jgi:hypothetical protein
MKIKELFILSLFAISLIIWIDFIPYKLNEFWPGTGLKLETLVHRISLAYITSFIFYYVVVFRKDQRNKKQLYPIIAKWSRMIVINNNAVLKSMIQEANLNIDNRLPSADEFKVIGKSIFLFNKANTKLNWTEYFQFHRKGTLEYIDKILVQINYLDSEHIRILTTLQNSVHFNDHMAYNSPKENINLESYHAVFFNFYNQINKLEQFNNKNFKKYYSQWTETAI